MPTRGREQELHSPWDTVLGTRSHVRVLRVLEHAREAMSVREVTRRADESLRAVQIAVSRLVQTGLVRREGSGRQQLVRWNSGHPLAPSIEELFAAERDRYDRIVSELTDLASIHAGEARSVWMEERSAAGGPKLSIGVLAGSRDIDSIVDSLREGIVRMMRREDLDLEVQGWSLPDLEALKTPSPAEPVKLRLLRGTLPPHHSKSSHRKRKPPKSHQAVDAQLLVRAGLVAEVLQRRPELVRLACDELTARLEAASAPLARTLREWLQVLESMSLPKLTRLLVDEGERSTRLRQSMPLTFLRATQNSERQE